MLACAVGLYSLNVTPLWPAHIYLFIYSDLFIYLFTATMWVFYRDVIDLPCQNFHFASLCNGIPIRRWNFRNLFQFSLSKIYQVLICCPVLSAKMSSRNKNLLDFRVCDAISNKMIQNLLHSSAINNNLVSALICHVDKNPKNPYHSCLSTVGSFVLVSLTFYTVMLWNLFLFFCMLKKKKKSKIIL